MNVKTKTILTIITIITLMISIVSYMLSYTLKYSTYHFATIYKTTCLLSIFSSIFYILMHLIIKKNKSDSFRLPKIIVILLFLLLYEFIISLLSPYSFDLYKYVDMFGWPVLFIHFYIESYENDYNKIYGYIIKFFMIFIYYASYLLIKIHLFGDGMYGSVVFSAYFCITFLPLLFYFSNSKIEKILYFIIALIIVTISTKRAGFLALITAGIAYIFIKYFFNNLSFKKIFSTLLIFGILSLFLMNYVQNSNLAVFERIRNLSNDSGSGRTLIWKICMDSYADSSLNEKIFGHGFQSVLLQLRPQQMARFAHNSYIEYIYDYGFVGITLLISYIGCIIKYYVKSFKTDFTYTPLFSFAIVLMIFFSMFSYFFEEFLIIIPISILFGILFGKYDKNIKKVVK